MPIFKFIVLPWSSCKPFLCNAKIPGCTFQSLQHSRSEHADRKVLPPFFPLLDSSDHLQEQDSWACQSLSPAAARAAPLEAGQGYSLKSDPYDQSLVPWYFSSNFMQP